MKLLRVIIVMVVPVMLLVYISSCNSNTPDCPKAFKHFDIYGIQAYNHGYDSTGNVYVKANNDTISFSEYYISVPFSVNYYSSVTPAKNNFLITGAYALDCVENGYGGSVEGLDSIIVIAKKDYNASLQSGDTVSHIFEASESYYGPSANQWKSLDDYAHTYRDVIYNSTLVLKPQVNQPFYSGPHSFRIIIVLRNGEKHITETPTVFFR